MRPEKGKSVCAGFPGTMPNDASWVFENTYSICVSGSYEPPGQFAPPWLLGSVNVPYVPFGSAIDGGVNSGPIR